MSTKMKWVIALFVLQLVAWIGIGVSSGMAAIGSIAAAIGMSAFGIAGFIVWHYESLDKLKRQCEKKSNGQRIGFSETKTETLEDCEQPKKQINLPNVLIAVALIVIGLLILIGILRAIFKF